MSASINVTLKSEIIKVCFNSWEKSKFTMVNVFTIVTIFGLVMARV